MGGVVSGAVTMEGGVMGLYYGGSGGGGLYL